MQSLKHTYICAPRSKSTINQGVSTIITFQGVLHYYITSLVIYTSINKYMYIYITPITYEPICVTLVKHHILLYHCLPPDGTSMLIHI